jgi:Uncharacterized alpha/beta hydrolase domain (DUF2235)
MKRLIVCFDGTWNAADSEKAETNVARIYRAIRANSGDDNIHQLAFYERGVGTTMNKAINLFAGATGLGVGDNIRSAYLNLAKNYLPGDEIYLFGFSRGAFSARSLAGLIGACSLLKRQSLDAIHKAWTFYREAKDRNPQAFQLSSGAEIHDDVSIKFLGVWDTVGALGVPVGLLGSKLSGEVFQFHNTTPSRIVKHASHALAIDEKRDEFVPTFWTGTVPEGSTIEQVWFAGCHSDVGGGYDERRIADIPLRWMAKRAESQGLQLDWISGALPPKDEQIGALTPIHDSRDSYSTKDRLTPTIRRVCELNAKVDLWEKLYAPRDGKGKIQPTINEFLHESVVERFGKQDALLSIGDKTGKARRVTYRPENLASAFNAAGQLKPGIATQT